MMELTNPLIQAYAEQWSADEDPLLTELDRETNLKTLSPKMMGGPQLSKLLFMLTKLSKAKSILEIGTFTGYSTLTFAKAMPEIGIIHTIESNIEIIHIAESFFKRSPDGSKIKLYKGDALDIIPTIKDEYDIVFMDGSKTQYSAYFDMVIDQLKPGGLILADNVLFYGQVLGPKMKPKTQSLHDFNKKIKLDSRVFNILLPIADGINCILKL